MMMHRIAAAAVAAALIVAACGGGGSSPGPAPTPGGGGNVTPPANSLPVIDSIVIQGTRPNEPAAFADLAENVPVAAKVHDDETAADQLEYQWSATAGTFTGTGASVVWQAPASASTPVEVTITLKVVEKYGFAGVPPAFSHDTSGTATLSLHDSVKEVGDMARQFLLDFSDSNIRDVPAIMRNFTDATPVCRSGKATETEDVANNRVDYFITQWSLGPAVTTVNFGGICPFRNKPGDACAQVSADWRSTRLTDAPADCPTCAPKGTTERAVGTDQVTAIYVREEKKWGLCESDFKPLNGLTSRFIR